MGIVVRVSDGSHRHVRWARLDGQTASIGRALDNHVILDDPHAAPHQLIIHRVGDAFLVKAGASPNPTRVVPGGRLLAPGGERLASGAVVRFGHSEVRLFDASHPVPDTQRVHPVGWQNPQTQAVLALGLVLLAVFAAHLYQTTRPMSSLDWISDAGVVVAMMTVWAGIWSGVSKMWRGRPLFFRHFAVVGLFYVAFTALGGMQYWIAFNLQDHRLSETLAIGVEAVLAVGLFAMALALVRRGHFIVNALGATLVVTFFLGLVAIVDEQTFGVSEDRSPAYSTALAPASWYVLPKKEASAYLEHAESLFQQAIDGVDAVGDEADMPDPPAAP